MLYLFILLPIGISMFILLVEARYHKGLILTLQICLAALAVKLFIDVDIIHNDNYTLSLGDYPNSIGILLIADPLSTLFVLLTALIFTVLLIYAINENYFEQRFLFLFLTLESLIMAIFLSGDLFNLYALIEVATIVVSILIMYKRDKSSMYDGMVYLLTNLVSMTFFLVGVGYVYKIFGTLSLPTIGQTINSVSNTRTLILPYAFLLTAVSLKIAAMPLFSWLPKAHGAHSAPFIVSAVLSGLYVKSSLYLFIRLNNIFGSYLDTHHIFLAIGLLTTAIGAYLALKQDDIKLFLAYSTVSQLGLIVFAFSIQTEYSYYGSIYHILSHALFKTTLFLGAGIISKVYGTRRISDIKGVYRNMPFISIMIMMAVLGIIGAPFFNGSVSKYLIKKGTVYNQYLEYILMVLNTFTIIYFIKFIRIFFGKSLRQYRIPLNKVFTMGLLGIICLITGVYGEYLVQLFFDLTIDFQSADYINKFIMFGINVLTALTVHVLFSRRIKPASNGNALELTFNELASMLVLFFAALLGYLMIIL